MFNYVVGEESVSIPKFETESYEAMVGYIQIDGASILCSQIKCFGVSNSRSETLYKELLVENGFYISSETTRGYKYHDKVTDLFVGYSLVTEEENPYFIIQSYLLQTREESWNTMLVNLYTEMVIPSYPAESYNTSYDAYNDKITIYANYVSKTAYSEYASTLVANGFTITAQDSMGGVSLRSANGMVDIVVYQSNGDYNCDALYITITNQWPSAMILSFIGFYLPKLNDSTAVYDGYTYLNISQDEDNPEYVICIYYKNASATIFNKYLIQLKNLGLLNDGVDSTENYLTAILTTVISDGTNDFQVTIKLMYQISSNTICLAVYEAAQK